MKNYSKIFKYFLIVAIAFIRGVCFAESYQDDLNHLKYAISMSNLNVGPLTEYLNPLKGSNEFRLNAENAPWAGNYFPMEDGGIANRWQHENHRHLNLQYKPTKDSLQNMRQDRLDRMSPSEKYDILMGDYNFSVTQHELNTRGPLRPLKPQEWEGFCNGVRCAGILLPEPSTAIEVKNKDGIKITFHPADLKALAGASYFYVENYAQLGAPTQSGLGASQPNAAVFDLALRYYLAESKKSFIIDSHLGNEIGSVRKTVSKHPRHSDVSKDMSYADTYGNNQSRDQDTRVSEGHRAI